MTWRLNFNQCKSWQCLYQYSVIFKLVFLDDHQTGLENVDIKEKKHEKPANHGTKAADVLDNFFSQQTQIHWIFGCICNYYDFTTTGEFWDLQFSGSWGGRLGFVPIESPTSTSQYISIQNFAVGCNLTGIPMLNHPPPPIRPPAPVWGLGRT